MRCTEEAIHTRGTNCFCDRHVAQWDAEHGEETTLPVDNADKATAMVKDAVDYADNMVEALGRIQITNQDLLDSASHILTEVRSQLDTLENERTAITKPMNEAKRKVDALFKPAKTALEECQRLLKGKIAGYFTAEEKRKADALKSGDHQTAIEVATPTTPEGVSVKSTPIQYRVIDFDQIPREFLCLDHSAVKILIKEKGDGAAVPGVEFYRDKQVAVGGTK
jgi:hypothetical protein